MLIGSFSFLLKELLELIFIPYPLIKAASRDFHVVSSEKRGVSITASCGKRFELCFERV